MKFGGIVLEVNKWVGIRFLIWRHNFKMAAMTSFHTKKWCHLVSARSVCPAPMRQRPPVIDRLHFAFVDLCPITWKPTDELPSTWPKSAKQVPGRL